MSNAIVESIIKRLCELDRPDYDGEQCLLLEISDVRDVLRTSLRQPSGSPVEVASDG